MALCEVPHFLVLKIKPEVLCAASGGALAHMDIDETYLTNNFVSNMKPRACALSLSLCCVCVGSVCVLCRRQCQLHKEPGSHKFYKGYMEFEHACIIWG